MKVTITTSKAQTEFDVPDSWEKVVRTLLHHIAMGAKSSPVLTFGDAEAESGREPAASVHLRR